MRVLVCGGRDFNDLPFMTAHLDALKLTSSDLIIHGAARGADTCADVWAATRGIPRQAFPADWNKYRGRPGKNPAGAIRNQLMLDEGKPDLVIAFPGGNGTANMVRIARRAGVEVRVIVVVDETNDE